MSSSEDKIRRQQRIRNHIAKDLLTPKYHQRVIQRKRVEDAEGNYYFDWIEEEEQE